jgi:hypothetical protein
MCAHDDEIERAGRDTGEADPSPGGGDDRLDRFADNSRMDDADVLRQCCRF